MSVHSCTRPSGTPRSCDMIATFQCTGQPTLQTCITLLADFKKLKTTTDYEEVVRTRVSGVPEHWVSDIAQQCVGASPSPQGRRHAPFLASAAACQSDMFIKWMSSLKAGVHRRLLTSMHCTCAQYCCCLACNVLAQYQC